MINNPKFWAIMLIGPPGSGKGTQAELLAEKFGLFHIQTSKLGEAKINNPDLVKSNSEVAEAKKLYDSGKLWPHTWTASLVIEKIEEMAFQKKGVVLDGSPRIIHEAVLEMPMIKALYGSENIKVFEIKLSSGESFKRNSHRRICKLNQHPIPNFPEYENITACPQDGSEIIVRTLDDPELIKKRYQVYKIETEPVIDFLIKEGYNVLTIDGEQSIEDVYRDILNKLW
jgi:adenylate kinase